MCSLIYSTINLSRLAKFCDVYKVCKRSISSRSSGWGKKQTWKQVISIVHVKPSIEESMKEAERIRAEQTSGIKAIAELSH